MSRCKFTRLCGTGVVTAGVNPVQSHILRSRAAIRHILILMANCESEENSLEADGSVAKLPDLAGAARLRRDPRGVGPNAQLQRCAGKTDPSTEIHSGALACFIPSSEGCARSKGPDCRAVSLRLGLRLRHSEMDRVG